MQAAVEDLWNMHESNRTMEASKQQTHEWQLMPVALQAVVIKLQAVVLKNNAHVQLGVTVTLAARSDSLVEQLVN